MTNQGNANHNVIPPHTLESLLYGRQKITSVFEDTEKRESSCTIGGYITATENSTMVPQKIKNI